MPQMRNAQAGETFSEVAYIAGASAPSIASPRVGSVWKESETDHDPPPKTRPGCP